MTENIENAEPTKDERTPEQVEIDRLKAESEVWRGRYTRTRDEYLRYRRDTAAAAKQADQTIENLNGKIASQRKHLAMHHDRDEVRAAEIEQMEAKLTSYSALLNLMSDAGRLPIEVLEHIDAGISAIPDRGSELPIEVADVKLFTGKNALQALRDYLTKQAQESGGKVEFDEDGVPQVTIMDDDDEPMEYDPADTKSETTEYVTPRDLPAYSEGPDMDRLNYTDVGLPKRPVKDKPQPGNDWADNDPEAPWNQ